jgi:hypothetical protein
VKQKEQVSFGPLLQRCVHAQSLLVSASTSWQMHFGIPVDKIIWLFQYCECEGRRNAIKIEVNVFSDVDINTFYLLLTYSAIPPQTHGKNTA